MSDDEIRLRIKADGGQLLKFYDEALKKQKELEKVAEASAKKFSGTAGEYFKQVSKDTDKQISDIKKKVEAGVKAAKQTYEDQLKKIDKTISSGRIREDLRPTMRSAAKSQMTSRISQIKSVGSEQLSELRDQKEFAKNLKQASELFLKAAQQQAKAGDKGAYHSLATGSTAQVMAYRSAVQKGLVTTPNPQAMGFSGSASPAPVRPGSPSTGGGMVFSTVGGTSTAGGGGFTHIGASGGGYGFSRTSSTGAPIGASASTGGGMNMGMAGGGGGANIPPITPDTGPSPLSTSQQKAIARARWNKMKAANEAKKAETLKQQASGRSTSAGGSKSSRIVFDVLGGAGMVGSTIKGLLMASEERDLAARRLRAVTGVSTASPVDTKLINDLARYGFTASQYDDYTRNLSVSRGYGGKGFHSIGNEVSYFDTDPRVEASRLMLMEKGMGLDIGTLSGLSAYQSFDYNKNRPAGQRGTSYDVDRLIKTMRFRGAIRGRDYSRAQEMAETLNQMSFANSQLMETIDTDQTIRQMGRFYALGGSFADHRMKERMGQISGALRNPGNDFKQAFNFSVLRKLNPSASFVQLRKDEESALENEGFFRETMRSMQQMAGSNDDLFEQLIQSRFRDQGITYQQSETLRKGFQAGALDKLTPEEQERFLRTQGLSIEGKDNDADRATTTLSKVLAMKTDTISGAGGNIAKEIDPFIDGLVRAAQGLDNLEEQTKKTHSALFKLQTWVIKTFGNDAGDHRRLLGDKNK